MRSLSVRSYDKFEINRSLPLVEQGQTVGNISPTSKTYNMDRTTFKIYDCSYFVSFNETIVVDIEGELSTVDQYQKSTSFQLYEIPSENLIIIDATTAVAKRFINQVEKQYGDLVKTNIFNFDFSTIGEHQQNTKAIYFAVEDDVVDNKIFFGNGVEQDQEAVRAIDDSTATYLMVEVDLRNKARTIGFSKKGAIVIYSTPNDLSELENAYLQLAYDAVKVFH